MRTHILTAALLCASTTVQAGTVSAVKNFGEFEASGSLDIEERLKKFDDSDDAQNMFPGDVGVYDVSNNTSGNLMGFGVSNNFTLPAIFDEAGNPAPFGCTDAPGYEICYSVRTLTANNWDTEIAFSTFDFIAPTLTAAPTVANVQQLQLVDEVLIGIATDYTFQDIFGDFAGVAGDDQMFNWFEFSEGEVFNPREGEPEMTAGDVVDQTLGMYVEVETALAAPLASGDSVDDFFGFLAGLPASSIIGHSANLNGNSFFTAGQAVPPAVPLPAAAWMLMAGIGGLGAIARRKKA